MLEHILRFMTLGSIIVGMAAIYAALHTNNRRLGADIFLRYSDRVSDLRRRLPVSAFLEGGAVRHWLWQAVAWCVGLFAVFFSLALYLYRTSTS